jgi:hypothetical protein
MNDCRWEYDRGKAKGKKRDQQQHQRWGAAAHRSELSPRPTGPSGVIEAVVKRRSTREQTRFITKRGRRGLANPADGDGITDASLVQ